MSLRLESADGMLAAEFQWQGDRYVHRLSAKGTLLAKGMGDTVARSVDGTDDEDWPSSPPLQQLSLEKINDQFVILGVGSGWSQPLERQCRAA